MLALVCPPRLASAPALVALTFVRPICTALAKSHRTDSCSSSKEIVIPPLKLQQAMQLVSMHFRYSVPHTHIPAAHLYHLRRARMCALSHPQNSTESRIKEACNELRLPDTYPGPPPIPPSVQRVKKRNHGKSYTQRSLVRDGQIISHWPRLVVSHSTCPPISPSPPANSFVIGTAMINTHRWHFLLSSSVSAHVSQVDHSDLPLTSRAEAYHTNYCQHTPQVMKKPPETTTMRDYAVTAIKKYWAIKFTSSSTA
jgi:hypothetical protein